MRIEKEEVGRTRLIWVGLKEKVGPLFREGETWPVRVTVPLKTLKPVLKSCMLTDVLPPATITLPAGGMDRNNWKSGGGVTTCTVIVTEWLTDRGKVPLKNLVAVTFIRYVPGAVFGADTVNVEFAVALRVRLTRDGLRVKPNPPEEPLTSAADRKRFPEKPLRLVRLMVEVAKVKGS